MKVGVIGAAGNMATAVIQGLLKSNYVNPQDLFLFDCNCDKLTAYADQSVHICSSNIETVEKSDYIIFCVKPQVLPDVLDEIKTAITPDKCLVSIAAGVPIAAIKKAVGFDCKVIRVMPNTPMLLLQGASALAYEPPVSIQEFEAVIKIFETAGLAIACEEEQLNAVTAVSGSGPAYVFALAKAMVEQGVALGLNEDMASKLTFQTMAGSAKMLQSSGKTPQQLIDMVTSPKGTTQAALEYFAEHHLDDVIKGGMTACKNRADELGKSE